MLIHGNTSNINTSISQKTNSVNTTISNNTQKIETIYKKFSKDFQEKGYIDLNNKKVSNIKEVADIAQVFRNPNYETFRILYTKGNTIVGQEAISSRIPGQTKVFEDNNRTKGFYKIKDRMNRLNADGYYMIHNHPTGKAIASQIDMNTTQEFIKNITGFKGHVIVNSGTYAVIEREKGQLSKLVARNEIVIENYKPDEIDKMINDGLWSNIKIDSNQQIAKIMHDVKNNPSYSTLILADSRLSPRIVLDIPNTFFNMQRGQIDGYIKNIAKQNGANRAFIATTNDIVYKSTNKLTTISDSILYSVKDTEIYQEDTLSKNDEDITKQKIFNTSDLKVKNTRNLNLSNKTSTSNNNIRSMKMDKSEVDNLGRKLSKQQQEFFKDSKVRDEKGNLKTMYHGSNNKFTIFKHGEAYRGSNKASVGYWFTDTAKGAENFANSVWYGDTKTGAKVYEVYLNIKNPKIYNGIDNTNELHKIDNNINNLKETIRKLENKNIAIEINKQELRWANSKEELRDIAKYEGIDFEDAENYHNAIKQYNELIEEYDNKKYNDSYELFRADIYKIAGKSANEANIGGTGMYLSNEEEIVKQYVEDLKKQGYDGIIIKNTKFDNETLGKDNSQYVVFEPNQIKNINNTNPTDNPDIRYLKKNTSSNILNSYDETTSNRIKMNTRNIIIENNEQLNNLIDEALTTNENKTLHLGKLSEQIVDKIKQNIQNLPSNKFDFLKKSTYDLVINQSEIRHLIEYKNTLSNEDIKHFIQILPEIIADSDYISYSNDLKNEGLRFKKLMKDGTYVSFIIVSNKQGTMKVKTIYMERGNYENKKRSISSSNNANKIALGKTSETNEASTSTTSIPQNQQNVNTSKKT